MCWPSMCRWSATRRSPTWSPTNSRAWSTSTLWCANCSPTIRIWPPSTKPRARQVHQRPDPSWRAAAQQLVHEDIDAADGLADAARAQLAEQLAASTDDDEAARHRDPRPRHRFRRRPRTRTVQLADVPPERQGAVPSASPRGSRGQEHRECAGRCGHPGHGVLDATTDLAVIEAWWGGRYARLQHRRPHPRPDVHARHRPAPRRPGIPRRAGTPVRPAAGDPHRLLRPLRRRCALLLPPATREAVRPTARPGDRPEDVDRLCRVAPIDPSGHRLAVHPGRAAGRHTARLAGHAAAARAAPAAPPKPRRCHGSSTAARSPTNTARTPVGPRSWSRTAGGASTRIPTRTGLVGCTRPTSACSATVRNGCLFVWSTSTVFDISEPGYPKGYTRFRAYALLNHDGDMGAAARALRGVA